MLASFKQKFRKVFKRNQSTVNSANAKSIKATTEDDALNVLDSLNHKATINTSVINQTAKNSAQSQEEASLDNAAFDLQAVLEKYPGVPISINLRGKESLGRKFELDLEKFPQFEESERCFKLAETKKSEGDFQEALALYTRAIENIPNRGLYYSQRALLLLKLNKPKQAYKDISQAIEISQHPVAYHYRGQINLGMKNHQEAIADFTRVIESEVKEEARVSAYFHRSIAYENVGDLKKAIEDATCAIKLAPVSDRAENYVRRADCYLEQRTFELAVQDYDQALRCDPQIYQKHVAIFHNRGMAKNNLMRTKEAIVDFSESLLHKLDAQTYYQRSTAYLEIEDYEKALKDADEAIKRRPNNAAYKTYRDQLKQRIQRASRMKTNRVDQLLSYENFKLFFEKMTRGVMDFSEGHQEQLIRFLELTTKEEEQTEFIVMQAAIVAIAKGGEKALPYCTKAIQLRPLDDYAYFVRSVVYSYLDQYDKALLDLNDAILLSPESGYLYVRRAYVHNALGCQAAAEEDMHTVARLGRQHESLFCDEKSNNRVVH